MTEIPVPLITTATAALKRLEDAPYGADHTERAIAVLTAVWPALRTAARVELNREVESLQSAWRAQAAPDSETTRPTDIPAELVTLACEVYVLDAPLDEDDARHILAMVLPAHERMVRAQVTVEIDAEIKATRPHFADPGTAALYERLLRALTLVIADDTEDDIRESVHKALIQPAQPAAPATGDTETTGGAADRTGDLGALNEQAANAAIAALAAFETQPYGDLRLNAARAAGLALTAIRPVLESYEQARADAWTIRDNYAAENRKLITERNTLKRDVIDASEANHALTKRAEQAERERDALRAAIAMHREYLDTNFRYWCSPHGIASDYATQLIAHLDTRTPPDGGA